MNSLNSIASLLGGQPGGITQLSQSQLGQLNNLGQAQQRSLAAQWAAQADVNNAMARALYEQTRRDHYPDPAPQPEPKMRTQAEIIADLEARYAELEREAADPRRLYPCATCRWAVDGPKFARCSNALVKGFETALPTAMDDWSHPDPEAKLCGPEKVLWEEMPPKPSLWERFVAWVSGGATE